ncbi:MAG: helix-turn-helix domain-containing protein [Clostridia bacterium]|nr:helix-turn-helix domain-containing protein [Clostridia bacterium]
MEFGDILKSIRRERGLSQDEMASLLGTTKQVISRYETKQRMPKLSIVAGYALKLGLPLSMLTGGDAEPEITREHGVRRVPILGGVACGEPVYNPGDGSEYATIEESVVCDFALIAQGDSMIGDRIYSGDVVFIRKQDSVRDGEIAAVALDDELTLKRVRRIMGPGGRFAFTQLLPSNPAYDPIEIGGEEETRCVNILGKAVAVRFML